MQQGDSARSRRLAVVVALTALAGGLVLAFAVWRCLPAGQPDWTFALVVAVVALGYTSTLSIRFGHQLVGFGLSEAPLVLALVLLDPAEVVLAVVVGSSGQLRLRPPPSKVLFNSSAAAIAAGASALLVALSGTAPSTALSWQAAVALVAAALLYWLVTDLLTATAIAVDQHLPVGRVLADGLGLQLLICLSNVALALAVLGLFATVVPTMLVLPPVLVCLYAAYRSYLQTKQEREALSQLESTTEELTRLDERQAASATLIRTAKLFRCEVVELELAARATGDPALRLRADAGGLHETVGQPGGQQLAASVIETELRTSHGALGWLRLGFREAVELSEREQRLLATLSHSISTTVLNARLYTEMREQAEYHAYTARHDGVTGLLNRRGLLELSTTPEAGPDGRVGVVILDLEHFREVNDTLGHAVGDDLLRLVAERLRASVRKQDSVARLSGDEFAVLLTGLDDEKAAEGVAEGLLRGLSQPLLLQGLRLTVEASAGIACHPSDGDDVAGLVRSADIALRSAKSSPGSSVRYSPELDPSSVERLQLADELRSALDADQLVLHFQPKVDLVTGAVVGAEALVRWAHPTRGLLMPNVFLEVMEQGGLVGPLTQRVLDLALAACATWREAGGPPCVSVNLSARNLLDRGLPASVAAALTRHGLPASCLVAEITETVMMSELDVVEEVLEELRGLGVQLSIDDFGTGYSSLTFLQRVPARELKIDRSFVSTMLQRPEDFAIVAATVSLARGLGLRSVAEGVETAEQRDALIRLGCEQAQGWHFGRPGVAELLHGLAVPAAVGAESYGRLIPLQASRRLG
jgi:diguanylate cyclase